MNENLTLVEVFLDKFADVGSGIGMRQIESLFVIILTIRFIILAFRYNMITSFLIVCINSVATYLWYRHIVDLALFYEYLLLSIKFTFRFGKDIQYLKIETLAESRRLRWNDPIGLFFFTFDRASDNDRFLIDPISMIFSIVPAKCKIITDKLYYFIYRDAIPNLIYCGQELSGLLGATMLYSYITRVNKKWCPYFIRWHWTMLLSYQICEQPFINLVTRSQLYIREILEPVLNGPNKVTMINYNPNYLIEWQHDFLTILNITVVLVHLAIYFYATFHAILGQYFYIPLLTTNADLHCGFAPPTKYRGGKKKWERIDWENAPTFIDNIKSIFILLKNFIIKIITICGRPFIWILGKFINLPDD
jgi:hypothetical protein